MVETRPNAPDRATRRRLERDKSKLANRDIQIVTLRRVHQRENQEDKGKVVDWSHRWVVSGHWRRVWHSSLQEHRLQWIAPFVKDPDNKPLILKRKVFKLVR